MADDDFISMKMTGDWSGVAQFFTNFPESFRRNAAKALKQEGEHLAGAMRKRFDGLKPANALITQRVKGSSKPLIDNGDMRNAIAAIETDDDLQLLIGIPAANERGVKLAAVHENGVTIVMRMTERQRRFLHWLYRKHRFPRRKTSSDDGQPGIIVIFIPPRPFIRPTFEEEKERSGIRFQTNLLQNLLADLL